MIRTNADQPLNELSGLIKTYTDDENVIEALDQYCKNAYKDTSIDLSQVSQLQDEPHVADWITYKEEARSKSIFEVLKSKLVPLNFPIEKGINQTPNYRNATLKGHAIASMEEAKGLHIEAPSEIELIFITGQVGTIPVLVIEKQKDFKSILRALVYKNNPTPISSAMGASIIRGLNNWHRLKKVVAERTDGKSPEVKKNIKSQIIKNNNLYQDTLIIASKKPYSNVYPEAYSKSEWLEKSLRLRIRHEYAHYLTLRIFGKMSNNMHDEILADYLGIHEIEKAFKASLFLEFIGLEDYPKYRKGGRLENYIGSPSLSDQAFEVLSLILYKSAHNIERFDQKLGPPVGDSDLFHRFLTITQFSLVELAADEIMDKMEDTFNRLQT